MEAQRKVQIYLEGHHYISEFPGTFTIGQLQEWMKFKPDFLHQLQENGKEKIPANANLNFRYNNMESNPTQKTLRLNEFHPKKRLIFYVDVAQLGSSSNNQNTGGSISQVGGGVSNNNIGYPSISQSIDRSQNIPIPPAASLIGGHQPVQPAKVLQNIKIIFKNEYGQTRDINISRKQTFKHLLAKADVVTTANNYRLQCTVGSNPNSIPLDYNSNSNKTLESTFGNESNGKVDLHKIYAAGCI